MKREKYELWLTDNEFDLLIETLDLKVFRYFDMNAVECFGCVCIKSSTAPKLIQ